MTEKHEMASHEQHDLVVICWRRGDDQVELVCNVPRDWKSQGECEIGLPRMRNATRDDAHTFTVETELQGVSGTSGTTKIGANIDILS